MSPPRRTPETTEALRTSLVAHALRLVEREGAPALTMRALAAEAGCAVGLPYKVVVIASQYNELPPGWPTCSSTRPPSPSPARSATTRG